MSAMPSIRSRALFPLFAAVVVAVACSSGSATGPDTSQNEQLILHFDTLKNSTSGIPPGIYLDIATILAEGAPVGNGTLTINDVALHVHTVAQRAVEYVQGAPLDSGYVVGAWTGGSDTVIELLHSGFFAATAIWKFGDTSGEDVDGTASQVPGPIGAACRQFPTPDDLHVPVASDCRIQPAADSFAIVLGGDDSAAVTLPNQSIVGIRPADSLSAPPPA